jgi:MFS family permease
VDQYILRDVVSPKPRSPLLPIFLIVLVDVLGFTIVIPLLAFYAEKFGASPLVATTLVSVYAVCSLISTPIIGNLSDTYGRKRLLIISQAGTCLGFLMLAWSHSLWMVFVGRILDGITAGNLSLAQAYISDHTKPENRAKAFGVIGVAFGIGFMFGPALGGVLGKYGLHVPFLVAAALSMTSIIATATLLKNEVPGAKHEAADGALPGGRRPGAFDVATYSEYFRRPRLGNLYLQFFLFTFAFSCFTSGFALFAERRFTTTQELQRVADRPCELAFSRRVAPETHAVVYLDKEPVGNAMHISKDGKRIELDPPLCEHAKAAQHMTAVLPWTAREVGILFAFSGLLGILLQGGLIGRLVKRFGERPLVVAGFASACVGYVVLGQTYTIAMIAVVTVFASFGNGVLRPVITSLITQVAGPREQGIAIGISGSLSSFAMMLAPPTGGALLDQHELVLWTCVPAVATALGIIVARELGCGP